MSSLMTALTEKVKRASILPVRQKRKRSHRVPRGSPSGHFRLGTWSNPSSWPVSNLVALKSDSLSPGSITKLLLDLQQVTPPSVSQFACL